MSNKKYLQLDSPDLYLNLQTKINTIQKNIRRRYFDSIKKGTNFKGYIEDIILKDTKINFNNRKNILHIIRDNYNRRFGVNYKSIRNEK